MADGEQLSDFLTSQTISIGLRSVTSGHDNTLSTKQKHNQTNNSIQRKDVTGGSISDSLKLHESQSDKVGGVSLEDDREDEGLKTIDCTAGVNHIPRLVFLGSDEDLTRTFKSDNETIGTENLERSEIIDSGAFNSNSEYQTERSFRHESSSDTEGDQRVKNGLTGSGRHSQTSVLSTDSELLTDHKLEDNTDDDIERFIMENEMTDDNLSKLMKWHCHDPRTFLLQDKMARNQLITVSILCFLFMVGEAVVLATKESYDRHEHQVLFLAVVTMTTATCGFLRGGAISNSLALFTDVLHLGSDLISFLISLLAIYLARKPATKKMSFGYHRAEVLGALFSVFIIWSVTGILVYMAIERIIHGHYKEVKADEMLITASLGVFFNLVMGFVLHSEMCCRTKHSSFGHNHSHGAPAQHSHSSNQNHFHSNSRHLQIAEDSSVPLLLEDSEELEEGLPKGAPKGPHLPHQKNINVRAAFIHVLGDIIQSIGVLIAALVIKLKPEDKYRLADPICTFLFSILVLFTTVNVLRDTLHVIMEGVPRDMDYHSIRDCLKSIKGVKSVHGLTVWCLTLEKNALAVHLAADPLANHKMVLLDASEALRNKFDFSMVTIQVEDYKNDIMTNCNSCQDYTIC